MKPRHDLVLRGGTVIDGSGGAPLQADVAIDGGRISAVGPVAGQGVEEIDARGRLVTPGFIDLHTHYDGQATWDRFLAPSSLHGVSTVVMGNCGVGFAPVHAADHDRIVELMEGVEDIPGTALHEGLRWNWSSFPEYLDALQAVPHDIDLCTQLPHAALRLYVMGERALRHERAGADDAARMRSLVGEAVRAGAFGVSTSRTSAHRSAGGELTPSIVAAEDELLAIAMGIRDAGGGVLEGISDWQGERGDDFAMFRRVVERSGVPCSISLMQDGVQPQRWREVLAALEAARHDGLTMAGQVAPRGIGLVVMLGSSVNPFQDCPSYAALAALAPAEQQRRLQDPALRARLLAEAKTLEDNPALVRRPTRARDFTQLYALGTPPNYVPAPGTDLAARAAARSMPARELFYEHWAAGDAMYLPLFNHVDGDDEACRAMLASEATLPGLGDGGAHVGTICDASFPTYWLTHWGRDRAAGRFPLPWLVRRLTQDSARWLGLHDRGLVAPGHKADLNVIDFDRLQVAPPALVDDLPAGGRRFVQGADGYEANIVSGAVVRRNDAATGALPGRLVRHRPASSSPA